MVHALAMAHALAIAYAEATVDPTEHAAALETAATMDGGDDSKCLTCRK